MNFNLGLGTTKENFFFLPHLSQWGPIFLVNIVPSFLITIIFVKHSYLLLLSILQKLKFATSLEVTYLEHRKSMTYLFNPLFLKASTEYFQNLDYNSSIYLDLENANNFWWAFFFSNKLFLVCEEWSIMIPNFSCFHGFERFCKKLL